MKCQKCGQPILLSRAKPTPWIIRMREDARRRRERANAEAQRFKERLKQIEKEEPLGEIWRLERNDIFNNR